MYIEYVFLVRKKAKSCNDIKDWLIRENSERKSTYITTETYHKYITSPGQELTN